VKNKVKVEEPRLMGSLPILTVKKNEVLQYIGIEEAPIEWAVKHPSIDDFTGIWSDHSATLLKVKGGSPERA